MISVDPMIISKLKMYGLFCEKDNKGDQCGFEGPHTFPNIFSDGRFLKLFLIFTDSQLVQLELQI